METNKNINLIAKTNRLNDVIAYLKGKRIAKTQKDIAKLLQVNEANLSRALKGNESYITNSFLKKIADTFDLNTNWLLTGDGDMLNSDGEMLKSEEDKRTDLLYTPGASQRVKKIINWLIFIEYAESERDLAQKLGYTMSSFFQIANGRVPLANKFVKKLCAVNNNINEAWIRTGEGEMFLNSSKESQETTISSEAWEVIKNQAESLKNQAESLKNKDEQINELIFLLKQEKENAKKTDVIREDNVISVG